MGSPAAISDKTSPKSGECAVKAERQAPFGYSGLAMPKKPLIPSSPREEDYLEQVAAAELPQIAAEDPIGLFEEWFEAAIKNEPNDPNAMTVATVDQDGAPDARMVLLKGVDHRGFVFFSNAESAKGLQLAANPRAALVFHWKSLRRQVRVRGEVELVSQAEADDYFNTRARSAQIGAWASDQSRPLSDRFALERRIAEFGVKFGFSPIPRPPQWSGWRVRPGVIEFWRDRPFRLHERLVFERQGAGWRKYRLYP
jgi:pyridoxamine 5'-phosphate oxidase